MCELKRRDLLLGASAMLLYGCGGAEKYNQGKDYYPVANLGNIFHWGKNSKIKINSNSSSITTKVKDSIPYGEYTSGDSSSEIAAFDAGVNQWASTLKEINVSIEFTNDDNDTDVKVGWISDSDMFKEAGSSNVLGLASPYKYILMKKNLGPSLVQSTAVHEFGHMLGIWSHSFDPKDIMYPYATSITDLSQRDKKTLTEFLYSLSPTLNLKTDSLPPRKSTSGLILPYTETLFTVNGCIISKI